MARQTFLEVSAVAAVGEMVEFGGGPRRRKRFGRFSTESWGGAGRTMSSITPGSVDGATLNTGNEHFLVFEAPDGAVMAVWTQSTAEGLGDHRIMFSNSADDGVAWSQRWESSVPAPSSSSGSASRGC